LARAAYQPRAAWPWSAEIHGEGQKAKALVVTTLATCDASAAACLHATLLPDHSNITSHDSTGLSLRQPPLIMRINQLDLC